MSNLRYLIALSMLSDIGPVSARKLLSFFKAPEKIFSSKIKDLIAVDGIGINKARAIKEFSLWNEVDKKIKILEDSGIKAFTLDDPSYPELLREIEDAPIVLYVKGRLDPMDRYSIAIVGSRKPSPYGILVAEKISYDLTSMGFTIVSGMARGIDALSHKSALDAGGRTIAVLGSGLDVIYPPENKLLMKKMVSAGCIISEFPPGTPPYRENFPRRNRLISGLSLGVLVIEATSDSGALITARYALEQGREVFAIPGNINVPTSKGTNELIRNGAILTRKAEDIIEVLAPVLKGFIRSQNKINREVNEEEKRLCSFLSGEPKQIDTISRESSMPSSKVLSILLALELKGIVKQISGKRFYLA